MIRQALIAGGGIGGLAAALSASRAGWDARLFERAPAFSEVGAGIQLGPNVVRVLHGWGLAQALQEVAAFPDRLQVRSAVSGQTLGELPLGGRAGAMVERYGAPYVTVHRADLQGLLLAAVQQQTDAKLHLERPLISFSQNEQAVTVKAISGPEVEGDALIGADGLWSTVRQQLLGDGLPRRTGHLAYRALMPQAQLPKRLRSQHVTAWLGPRMHVVHYPVRRGEWLNVVAIVEGETTGEPNLWDHSAHACDLARLLAGSCTALQERVAAMDRWRLWALHDRAPMQGRHQQAVGRVALLGDAAHPMLPYLAQGAGMAIEDAAELGHALAQALDPVFDVSTMLQRYALNRWQRNARVQARALRNGQIFHAQGLLRWGRDASLKLLGGKLLDMPWLYGAVPRGL
ncbi:FAD-dependent monooxygenase [Polaromonas jejuensis]|uniref:FAD-dependent monooxygenase n=1 Tax=Polaromonas jejuensis TaxID=457502 RepID=A0ABW0QAQ0_9BURK|nr:FAD-dependent monooxygenase [Polaromonas jejuensis]